MTPSLTRTESWSLLTLSAACLAIIANTFQGDGEPLIASLAFSGIAFALTFSLIVWLGPAFMKAGLKGTDMSKTKKVEMLGDLFISAFGSVLMLGTDQKLWALSAP